MYSLEDRGTCDCTVQLTPELLETAARPAVPFWLLLMVYVSVTLVLVEQMLGLASPVGVAVGIGVVHDGTVGVSCFAGQQQHVRKDASSGTVSSSSGDHHRACVHAC